MELSGLIFEGFLYNSNWFNTVLTGPLSPHATLNMYMSSLYAAKQNWVKGISGCTNEGPCPFLMGNVR